MGPKILAAYRALRAKPRSDPNVSKWGEIKAYIERVNDAKAISPAEAARLAPAYVAAQAIRAEVGGGKTMDQPVDKAIKARYPATVRKRWSPEAQRLWLEAFCDPFNTPLPEFQAQIARLRRDGADVGTLEAMTVGVAEMRAWRQKGVKASPQATRAFERSVTDQMLRYAEAHPRDVVAVSSAWLGLAALVISAQHSGQPWPQAEIDRLLALEGRTVANLRALLNDPAAMASVFDRARRLIAKGRGKSGR